jgi:magnesium transporter
MIQWRVILSTDAEALSAIGRELNVHPLALEDCQHRDQRPKLDDYEHHQLLVWFLMAKGEIYEIQFLIFKDQVVFVPHDPPPDGTSWTEYLRITEHHRDVWHLLYQALDHSTDTTWRELRGLFSTVDNFEQEMFKQEFNPQELLSVKKRLNQVDYSIGHLSSVAEQLQNLCRPSDDLNWKLRDLQDHCERIDRTLSLYRSQIATTIELFWGLQANRTNKQIKRLSLLASVAVPMTFWASFWGMNFKAIPFDDPTLFLVAMAVMAGSALLAIWVLVRKGYWAD